MIMYLVQPEASLAPNNIIAPPTKAMSGITPVAEPHVPDITADMAAPPAAPAQ